jgi:predicted regulator of Ras-like GTPase activity (Roadblock/LC7/MglB family)
MAAVPGATGAILADWEGESVEQCCRYDEFALKVIAAHKGILLNLMKDVHQKLEAGELQHTVVSTDEMHFMTGSVGKDYFLVLTLDKTAIVALAARYFQETIDRMFKEIY